MSQKSVVDVSIFHSVIVKLIECVIMAANICLIMMYVCLNLNKIHPVDFFDFLFHQQ